jgi:hypothetical protein
MPPIGAFADGEPARLLDIPAFGFLRTLAAAIIGVIVILFGRHRPHQRT